MKSIQEKIEK